MVPGATAAAQKCLPLPRLGSAHPSGLHGNGLRGRLLIRNESFLSSAPFPHSHLCGCFCLKQIGLRVDEAAPVGKAASVAAALRPVSRSGSPVRRGVLEQWQQPALAPSAGCEAAVCPVEAAASPGVLLAREPESVQHGDRRSSPGLRAVNGLGGSSSIWCPAT